jgi:hypothetical protein
MRSLTNGESEESEADNYAEVADERKNPHVEFAAVCYLDFMLLLMLFLLISLCYQGEE